MTSASFSRIQPPARKSWKENAAAALACLPDVASKSQAAPLASAAAANPDSAALPTAWLRGSAAAAGIAWINSVGNLGGFVGPYGVGYLRDATGNFAVALAALAGMLVIAAILAVRAPRASAS